MDEKLRGVIADTLGIERDDVKPELGKETEEAWDSLNHLRLVTAVEEAFGIKLTMAEIQRISTATDLDKCISSHVSSS